MKKLFLLLAAIVSIAVCAQAQITVHGTVLSSADDEPLIGATVMPVGSGQGVATDIDGRFTLTIPVTVKELRVSYVGMQEKTVGIQAEMKIYLDPATTLLDNVVVTGYGSAKKLGSVVGAVNVVTSQKFEDSPSPNIVDALQGAVPGLAIFSNSGEPSAVPGSIRIRGINSLEADNTPLFILDGAPVSSSILNSLNMNDIENVTVLKDAASTAIYGTRAANGVIQITTKKGRFGEQAKVTIRANYGWSAKVEDNLKLMNSAEFIKFRDIIGAPVSQAERDAWEVYGISTDWGKELIKDNATIYSMDATVQGGTERTRYFLSLGHFNQDGLIAYSGFNRTSLRANLDSNVKSWLKVGFQANLSYSKYQVNNPASYAGNFYTNNPYVLSKILFPYDSPWYYTTDENGRINYHGRADYFHFSQKVNANTMNALNHGGTNRTNANIMLYEQIMPVKGLTIKSVQAMDAYDGRGSSIWYAGQNGETPMGDYLDFGAYSEAERSESFSRYWQFTYTNTAEYAFSIDDKHNFSALVGQESISNKTSSFGVGTSGQPSNKQMLLTNGTTVAMNKVSQSQSKFVINSWFFSLNYDFDNRYFLDAMFRRDGCSKFSPGHRWANFFSVGVMWNAKNEKFLSDVKWLDDLRLRVNYGTGGNTGMSGNYNYFGAVGSGLPYDGESTMGIASMSNDLLSWETVRSFSAGINYGFLNHLYGSVEFYVKNTDNMLLELPMSLTTGFGSSYANVGTMRNTGVDVEFGAHIVQTKDWYVGASVNFNYNKNEITKLFNGKDDYTFPNYGYQLKLGEVAYQYYGVRYAGVDPRDGKQMWYTKEGNLTKTYDEGRDAVGLKKSFFAPWNGGFGVNARWKGLSLRADFNWSAQKYIMNYGGQLVGITSRATETNMAKYMLKIWQKPGDITDIPAASETTIDKYDSRYLEDASFIRMKNLTIGYSLPKSWMRAVKMEDVTFHFTGRNLLTFTRDGYTGTDPEYEGNIVRFSFPNSRQYEFGVEVTF